jgi:hypothetical protein
VRWRGAVESLRRRVVPSGRLALPNALQSRLFACAPFRAVRIERLLHRSHTQPVPRGESVRPQASRFWLRQTLVSCVLTPSCASDKERPLKLDISLFGIFGNRIYTVMVFDSARKTIHTARYDRLRRMLIAAREQAGLTQMEVADALGRHQSFVSKYEIGERRIDVEEFLQIADALQIDAVSLLRSLLRQIHEG